ncbi:methyltransferase type 11 [Gymnopilus junonius]|uniref:Methyltransferase type 11 n=1 Tax=Gymnopilus junonius TaxID=109634 RepID=A0A9P5P0B1_GYMJU|nr:methyltransferase type 11 [Gymnopilus junonius]
MGSVHEVAQSGFGARPSYQPFSLDFIRESTKASETLNIVEIGSGTGIFTRALLADPKWNSLIRALRAFEPSEGMREVFSKTVKDSRVSVSEGYFDATGVEDGWADLVIVAQAFHWCPNYNAAAAEFARILKPNGIVALVWNLEDRLRDKWAAQIRDLIEVHEQGTPQYRHNYWRQVFETPPYKQSFEPPKEQRWSYYLTGTKDSAVDRALSKNEMTVSFYANLPLEVKQVLRIADFNLEPYSGGIDTVTGFALVTSFQTCFVWQHAQAIKGIPTCYIFSCPYNPHLPRPPFHALVPQGSSREPGLILVSPGGQIRFWDSISMGLAGGDNFVQSQLEDLDFDEEVTNLVRIDPQTYALSTSYGRLYRLIITSIGGKYHITIRAFARPPSTGSFSRYIPFLSSSSSSSYDTKDKARHIHAVSLGHQSPSGERELFALANGRIQHWSLKPEGWEELLLDIDPTTYIAQFLQDKGKNRNLQSEYQDLELSDLAVFEDGNIAVLVSYTEKDEDNNSDDFRRLYALAELESLNRTYRVKHLNSVPFQTTSKPGPPVHPRIQLIYGGYIISVQFGEAVALCARGSEFSDRLELKSTNDRTLGVGVSPSTNLLLVLTASTMMKISLDLERIQAFKPETGHTNLVKSIMIQAILYGPYLLNPLKFSFPPSLNAEALMEAAQQLSSAVLESNSEVVRQIPDMTAQMTGRKERLSWLIGFINEGAVLYKMSQSCRHKLATDAEKLYACHRLWLDYNKFLSTSPSQSVLKDAITDYMIEIGDDSHEDLVRAFFRSRVVDIGKILRKVSKIVESASLTNDNVNSLLAEANRIVTTVLESAFDYRTHNLKIYGLRLPVAESWSSRRSVIDTVISLFKWTTEVTDSIPGYPARVEDKEPSSQLPSLARVLLRSMKERLDWLSSAREQNQAELESFQQKMFVLRPEVVETLRRCGHEETAFSQAEEYDDYASLVALCHRQAVYPPEKNPHAERLRYYVRHYKKSFTAELFQWYIQHGEVRVMFDQESPGAACLDDFFRERPVSSISWINDIGKLYFGSAASTLLQGAGQATNLEAKHLMLSIGKLSLLAQTQETNVEDDTISDAFHNGLDVVSVHESLLHEFRSVLVTVRTRQSIDSQVDTILNVKGSSLAGKTAFAHIFRDLLRQLLQGKALSIEDLVELLTLKDNAESVDDFARSLQLLSSLKVCRFIAIEHSILTNCFKDLPEARLTSATRTVWRRVYLHDDWDAIQQTSGVSDDELNARYKATALYATLRWVLQKNQDVKTPAEALQIPPRDVVVSRWPGMSTEQVESLEADYTFEQDRLGEWELDGIFERIREMAGQAEVQ